MPSVIEQTVADIIQNQMGLTNDRIWIQDQNRIVPTDEELYVVVGTVDETPIGTHEEVTYTEIPDTDPQEYVVTETLQAVTHANVQIDIASRNLDAITRRWEILTALRSIFAQQAMEEVQCKVFRIPRSFTKTSGPEGGSNLNRYTLVIPCHMIFVTTNTLPPNDYYDDFKTRVDDEKTIGQEDGLIEFEITGDSIIGG